MQFGFTRRVEKQYIDLNKMAEMGLINRDIENSPNGFYSIIVVPDNLTHKLVLVMPLSERGTLLTIKSMEEDGEGISNPQECPFLTKNNMDKELSCSSEKSCPKEYFMGRIKPKCWNLSENERYRVIRAKRKTISSLKQCPDENCPGELVKSHDIPDEDRTSVYYCNICRKGVNRT